LQTYNPNLLLGIAEPLSADTDKNVPLQDIGSHEYRLSLFFHFSFNFSIEI